MFQSVRRRRSTRKAAEIEMAPLIDMVFILLIFFLVTTTFVRETGVEVRRPNASTAVSLDKRSLLVGVDPQGNAYIEEQRVDLLALRSIVERRLQSRPELSVVLVADRDTATGDLIRVLDACRLAGAQNIAVSSRKDP